MKNLRSAYLVLAMLSCNPLFSSDSNQSKDKTDCGRKVSTEEVGNAVGAISAIAMCYIIYATLPHAPVANMAADMLKKDASLAIKAIPEPNHDHIQGAQHIIAAMGSTTSRYSAYAVSAVSGVSTLYTVRNFLLAITHHCGFTEQVADDNKVEKQVDAGVKQQSVTAEKSSHVSESFKTPTSPMELSQDADSK